MRLLRLAERSSLALWQRSFIPDRDQRTRFFVRPTDERWRELNAKSAQKLLTETRWDWGEKERGWMGRRRLVHTTMSERRREGRSNARNDFAVVVITNTDIRTPKSKRFFFFFFSPSHLRSKEEEKTRVSLHKLQCSYDCNCTVSFLLLSLSCCIYRFCGEGEKRTSIFPALTRKDSG